MTKLICFPGIACLSVLSFSLAVRQQDLKQDVQGLKDQVASLNGEVAQLKREDIASLRKMQDEFRTELTKQGADFDETKIGVAKELKNLSSSGAPRSSDADIPSADVGEDQVSAPESPFVTMARAITWLNRRLIAAERKLRLRAPPMSQSGKPELILGPFATNSDHTDQPAEVRLK